MIPPILTPQSLVSSTSVVALTPFLHFIPVQLVLGAPGCPHSVSHPSVPLQPFGHCSGATLVTSSLGSVLPPSSSYPHRASGSAPVLTVTKCRPCLYSFSRRSLSTQYVPGTVLGTGDAAENTVTWGSDIRGEEAANTYKQTRGGGRPA